MALILELKKVIKMEISEIQQQYCNAVKTSAGALGHTKAHHNERNAAALKKKLIDAGETVPTDNEAYEQGLFNGPGSW